MDFQFSLWDMHAFSTGHVRCLNAFSQPSAAVRKCVKDAFKTTAQLRPYFRVAIHEHRGTVIAYILYLTNHDIVTERPTGSNGHCGLLVIAGELRGFHMDRKWSLLR